MNVFDLVAVLSLNKKGYDDGLKSAEKDASSFGSKLKSGLKTAGKVATASLALVGASAVGLTKKLLDTSSATAELGDHIDKQSQKIGISAKAYQEWDFILTHNGASVDSLQASMKTLSSQARECASEFADLGITEEYLATATPEELFERVVKELQGMENSTERTAIAAKLLGRSATELSPVFNSTSEEIEAMRQQAHDLGKVMSDEAVKSGAAYEDSLYNLQTAIGGLRNKLGTELLPSIVNVMDGLTGIFAGDDSAVGKLSDGISNLADNILKAIPKVADLALKLVTTLGDAVVKNLPTIIDGIVRALPELMKAIVPLIEGVAKAFMDNIDILLDAAIDIMNMMIDYVVNNIGTIVDGLVEIAMKLVERVPDIILPIIQALPDILKSIIQAISNNLPVIISGLMDVMVQIVAALPDLLVTIIDALPDLIGQLLDAILNSLPQIIDGLVNVVLGIVGKLDVIIISLVKAIPQIIAKLLKAVLQALPQIIKGLIQLVIGIVQNIPQIIKGLIEAIPDIIASILSAFGDLGEGMFSLFSGIFDAAGSILGGIGDVLKNVFSGIVDFFGGVKDKLSSVFGWIGDKVSALTSWVTDIINKTKEVTGVEKSITDVGYTVKVPKMASGGILERGEVGLLEGNGAEAVVPLENNHKWISAVARDMQGALMSQNMMHSGTIRVEGVDKDGNNVDIYDYIISQTTGTMRRQVRMA